MRAAPKEGPASFNNRLILSGDFEGAALHTRAAAVQDCFGEHVLASWTDSAGR